MALTKQAALRKDTTNGNANGVTMQHRHFALIAAAIKATRDRIGEQVPDTDITKASQLRGVRRTAAHLADALAQTNPRFDAGRFLTACGYGATTMNPTDPALDLRPL